jgi:hypothetical protein
VANAGALGCLTALNLGHPMSSSPGWPAHSKPSMLIASTPSASPLSARRTATASWITFTPAALNAGRCGAGLENAVSTIFTPHSMITSRYSS